MICQEFLNFLYDKRAELKVNIEKLRQYKNAPKSYCDKCQSTCDETAAKLFVYESAFVALDETIEKYLNLHSK